MIIPSKIANLLILCDFTCLVPSKLVTLSDSLFYVLPLKNYNLLWFEDVPAHSTKFKSKKGMYQF